MTHPELRPFELLRNQAGADATVVISEERALLKGSGSYSMPWHAHDCLMLLLPCAGTLKFEHEDQAGAALLSEDRFAVVPAGCAHKTRALRDKHAHLAFYLTGPALRRIETERGSLDLVRRQSRSVALFRVTPELRALERLCQASEVHGTGRAAFCDHVAAALLIESLAIIEEGQQLTLATRHGHGEALVSEIKAFIEAQGGHEVSLDQLSDHFGISRRHLTRLFRERTGLSIGQFQQTTRLEAARRLIVETDLPIGEIAYRVGFEDGSVLARAMRRFQGSSPTDIRMSRARSAKQ